MVINCISINAGFRKYPSTKESLKDYSDLIKNGIDGNRTIYKPTWKSEAILIKMQHHTYLKHMLQIQTMLRELNSIIKHYQLTQFDDERYGFR